MTTLNDIKIAPGVPEVMAVVDIGSNAIRMVVAQLLPDGRLEVLERLQRAVRLGQDTFRSGQLRSETMRSAVSILRDYQRVMNTYGAGRVRAVATSAIREAANGDTFVDRILMATGIAVSVISVAEEGRLTVSAVHRTGAEKILKQGDALVVEVGGGSTIMTLLHDGEIAASQSLPTGSVRMQEILSTNAETAGQATRLIKRQVSSAISTLKGTLPLKNVQTFIAVGGDARWAAAQVGKPVEGTNLRTISLESLDALLTTCGGSKADELARTYHLSFVEAETLTPALLVYQVLLKATGSREMTVVDVSMRDGILWDLVCSAPGRKDGHLYDEVIQSAHAIMHKYRADKVHAEHTRTLAVRLFDELAGEHRLSDRHRTLLEVAALLHEVGTFVSSRAYHKHTYYLIANSEILGLAQDELAVVANVARYHRRSRPKPFHENYIALPRESRMIVNKLAAILRVADALDVSRTQSIQDFRCHIDSKNVFVISVPAGLDLILEQRTLAEKADMFQDIYGLDVLLEEATGL
jgi:exopolyphosphatase / guanosine-5'-triphosphate,3'-diphosphate pyrophosphatase